MYHYFLNLQLYILSLLFGFYLSSMLVKNKYVNENTIEDDLLEKKMIEQANNYLFQYKYLEELDNLNTDNSSNIISKHTITTLDIPFLNNKIIMFYDPEKEAFCYYTKSDLIYKYLNVACRKYIIENNCKHLYEKNDLTIDTQNTQNTVYSNLFVKKIERPQLNKKTNKFILCGTLDDYEKSLIQENMPKQINIKEYLAMNASF